MNSILSDIEIYFELPSKEWFIDTNWRYESKGMTLTEFDYTKMYKFFRMNVTIPVNHKRLNIISDELFVDFDFVCRYDFEHNAFFLSVYKSLGWIEGRYGVTFDSLYLKNPTISDIEVALCKDNIIKRFHIKQA